MMATLPFRIMRLLRDQRGTMLIETAIVAPVLIILAVGGFEASTIVARQTELQTAAAEAAAIVRASPPVTYAQRTVVRDVLVTSTGLPRERVWVGAVYRCGTSSSYVLSADYCSTSVTVNKFIRVNMRDTYLPIWGEFGIGSPITYRVTRTIQIG